MKYTAAFLYAVAALVMRAARSLEWLLLGAARYFATEDLDALALQLEAEDQAKADAKNVTSCHIPEEAPSLERAEYEAKAMAVRIQVSELTRTNVSRLHDGQLVDVWIEDFNPNACREEAAQS